MKRVAIVQSCYIPWKGYFDMIALADEFILFDDRQYTKRDWRNRNRIKTPQGTQWLTIPVETKGRYHQRIDETVVSYLTSRIERSYAAARQAVDLLDTEALRLGRPVTRALAAELLRNA